MPPVVDLLTETAGIVAIRHAPLGAASPGLAEVNADLARECANQVLNGLHHLGITERGMIVLDEADTAIGKLAGQAERDAPGEAADALVWDELIARTGEESMLTGTFVAFIVLATLLAAIGVVTDSPITIVGAMVVGPESARSPRSQSAWSAARAPRPAAPVWPCSSAFPPRSW